MLVNRSGTDRYCDPQGKLRVREGFPRLQYVPPDIDVTNQSSFSRICRSLSTTHLTIILFVLIAPIYALSPHGRPSLRYLTQGAEMTRVALNVAQSGNFADPYEAMPTGPTAHVAPAYVFLYALVAKLFGIAEAGATALWLLNIGFLALQLALLPLLSERLGIGVLPGVLATVFGVVFQPYRVFPEWEALFTGLLLVSLCVLTVPYFESPREWQRSALLGFFWGIAILANPQCVLLLFAWPIAAVMKNSPEQLMRARRAMVVVALGAALACLPWFIRNYQRFHAIFFVRDSFGLVLYSSNNPCAQPTLIESMNSGCYQKTNPNVSPVVAAEVLDQGEIQFNRGQAHKALLWITSNPRAFASLTARRFLKFWFPYLNGLGYAIPAGILTVLSLLGLAVMFRKNPRAAWVLASTLLLYPLVHYISQFEARYRYPIFWATFLPAAYAVVEFIRWWRRSSTGVSASTESRVRVQRDQHESLASSEINIAKHSRAD